MPMCWRRPACQRKDHFVKLAETLQKLTDQFAKFKALRFPTGMGRTKRKGFRDGRLSERKLRASNPGSLRMLTYLPANLPDAPALVVVERCHCGLTTARHAAPLTSRDDLRSLPI